MKSRRILRVLSVVFIMIIAFGVPSGAYSYWEAFRGAYNGTTRWDSPTRNSSDSETWLTITSKWSEPRNVNGTSPHVGVDIGMSNGTPIYAVYSGYADYLGGTYKVLSVKHTSSLYCHYEHVSSVNKTGNVYKGDKIAFSGDGHLHFGAYDKNSVSGRKAYRNETFYRDSYSWGYGREVDVYSQCKWLNNDTAQITAIFSGADNNNTEEPSEVRIYHRKAGTSSWTDGGLMQRNGTYDYTYSFGSKYSSGTAIQWMVRIKRNNIYNYSYAWAPSKYYQPDPNPNANGYAYAYFSNTVY